MGDTKTLDARVYGTPQSGANTIADPDAEIVHYLPHERYETRRVLGEGGMGEVRLCTDRAIGRDVAMKVVLDMHHGRNEIRARFEREARIQGQLEHPAIVPVYDVGRDKDGRAYFTMRRVHGVTLERVLDELRAKNPVVEREHTRHKLLSAFHRVCLAIQYASEHGVIHRDLKPANIMLGRHGEVYVLDWGLAKVQGSPEPVRSQASDPEEQPPSSRKGISGVSGSHTAAGSVLGTPQYMSPEQIRGEDLDARSDVYSLGAILFEILTLEPLHGDGPVAQILHRAVKGADARASVRAPDRDVPPELEAACVRATALDPAQRFANAGELADVVDAYASGDRDLALRRALAKVHLERAREALARSRVPGASADERSEALRETGRAIALAPDDRDAVQLLVELLTKPPETVPAEVRETIQRDEVLMRRRVLPHISMAFLFVAVAAFAIQWLQGIKDGTFVAISFALWLLAAAVVYGAYKLDKNKRGYYPYVTLVTATALATNTLIHGPFLIVPPAATALAMGATLTSNRKARPIVITSLVVAVGLPVALVWAGVHPAGVDFRDDVMALSSAALHLPRDATLGFLLSMYVIMVVVAARFGGVHHDNLMAEKTRNELQAWQLRQLVPEEAAKAIGGLPDEARAATRRQ